MADGNPSKEFLERSAVFQKLFRLPRSEKLEAYHSCAYLKKILLQGRMYLSRNYLCFYSNVFGYETKVIIHVNDVTKVSKKNTAYVIPNAIEIKTKSSQFFFASFIQRDVAFENILKMKSYSPEYKSPKSDNDGFPSSAVRDPVPVRRTKTDSDDLDGDRDSMESKDGDELEQEEGDDYHNNNNDNQDGNCAPHPPPDSPPRKNNGDGDQAFNSKPSASSSPDGGSGSGSRAGSRAGSSSDSRGTSPNGVPQQRHVRNKTVRSPDGKPLPIAVAVNASGNNNGNNASRSRSGSGDEKGGNKSNSNQSTASASASIGHAAGTTNKTSRKNSQNKTPEQGASPHSLKAKHRSPRSSSSPTALAASRKDFAYVDSPKNQAPSAPATKSEAAADYNMSSRKAMSSRDGIKAKNANPNRHTRIASDKLPLREKSASVMVSGYKHTSPPPPRIGSRSVSGFSKTVTDAQSKGFDKNNGSSSKHVERSKSDFKFATTPSKVEPAVKAAQSGNTSSGAGSKGEAKRRQRRKNTPVSKIKEEAAPATEESFAEPSLGPVFKEPRPPQLGDELGKGTRVDFHRAAVMRFPFSASAFWDLFMSNGSGSPLNLFHKLQGDEGYKCSAWQPVVSKPGVKHRQIYFVKTGLSGPLGPKQTRVHKIQRAQFLKGGLVIDSNSLMPDVPYGGYFYVTLRWVVVDTSKASQGVPECYAQMCPSNESLPDMPKSQLKGPSCLLQMWTAVEFNRFTILRSQIKSFSNTGVRKFATEWVQFAKDRISSLKKPKLKLFRKARYEPGGELMERKSLSEAEVQQPTAAAIAAQMMVQDKTKLVEEEEPERHVWGEDGFDFRALLANIVGKRGYLSMAEGVSILIVLLAMILLLFLFDRWYPSPAYRAQANRLATSASAIATQGTLTTLAVIGNKLPLELQLTMLEAQAAEIGKSLAGLILDDSSIEKAEVLALRDRMMLVKEDLSRLRDRELA